MHYISSFIIDNENIASTTIMCKVSGRYQTILVSEWKLLVVLAFFTEWIWRTLITSNEAGGVMFCIPHADQNHTVCTCICTVFLHEKVYTHQPNISLNTLACKQVRIYFRYTTLFPVRFSIWFFYFLSLTLQILPRPNCHLSLHSIPIWTTICLCCTWVF